MKTRESAGTIRAQLYAGAAERMGRFFHASAEQALTEVLDNARLAGATRLRISTEPARLTIEDDGCGIARPELILSFGESGWKNPDGWCDGVGMYALSNRDAEIATVLGDGDGWRVRLQKEHFDGDAEARIEPFYNKPEGPRDETLWPHGTRVSFHYPRTIMRDHAVESAVRHLPMAVTIDGEPVEWRDPLAVCTYCDAYEGARIGIERHDGWHGDGKFHFHAQTIADRRLPRARCGTVSWIVRVDATEAGGLRRALPGRTRIEENETYKRLVRHAEQVLYTAMAREDDIEPNHTTWQRARDCGVEMQQPKPRLESWRPDVADTSGGYETREPAATVKLDGSEVLVFGAFEPGDEQVIARAVAQSGKDDLKLVRANPDRAGFEWYDRLRRLTGYGAGLVADGGKRRSNVTRPGMRNEDCENERVDEISMYLEITDPQARGTDREMTYVPVETDLLIMNPKVRATPCSLGIKLLATSRASMATLRDLMAKTCFRVPADGNGHAGDGRHQFEVDAEEVAQGLINGKSEALARALAKIAEREIGPLVGRNAKVTIRFADDGAKVRVEDRYAETAKSGSAS